MKKVFVLGLLLILIGLILNYKDTLLQYASKYYGGFKKEVVMDNVNEYYRDYDFEFVQNTKNFYPNNKQELLNVYYTIQVIQSLLFIVLESMLIVLMMFRQFQMIRHFYLILIIMFILLIVLNMYLQNMILLEELH